MSRREIHDGAESGRFFSKKTVPGFAADPTPSTQRLRVTGRLRACGMSTSATRV
jgi:hypothetical protein